MAGIQAEIKRGFLRSLYRQVTTALASTSPGGAPQALTLQRALDAFQDQGFSALQRGRIIIKASGAGRNTELAVPDAIQSFTQEQVFSLTEEFEQVYADALVNLANAGNKSPTDAQIFSVMIADDRLATITSVQKDYTLMRWPGRY